MKLLLDQRLPRTTVANLRLFGIVAIHAANVSLSAAPDIDILDFARSNAYVIVSLDADFHTLLAVSNADSPSVIRIRIEGLRAASLAELVNNILNMCKEDLEQGSMVSVTDISVRVRHLPLLR
jgi:predicted nuclease of predicted toxin-antitoxin system